MLVALVKELVVQILVEFPVREQEDPIVRALLLRAKERFVRMVAGGIALGQCHLIVRAPTMFAWVERVTAHAVL